jgi:hypothetical protein
LAALSFQLSAISMLADGARAQQYTVGMGLLMANG